MTVGTWTPERIQTLKKLWEDGHSAGQIAAQFQADITRNAVIGKVARLKLVKRSTTVRYASYREQVNAKRKCEPPVRTVIVRKAKPQTLKPEPLPPVEYEPTPSKLCTLADWPDDGCRWIYTDPAGALRYGCKCEKIVGASYCQNHFRRVFDTPEPNRMKPRPAAFVRMIEKVDA